MQKCRRLIDFQNDRYRYSTMISFNSTSDPCDMFRMTIFKADGQMLNMIYLVNRAFYLVLTQSGQNIITTTLYLLTINDGGKTNDMYEDCINSALKSSGNRGLEKKTQTPKMSASGIYDNRHHPPPYSPTKNKKLRQISTSP